MDRLVGLQQRSGCFSVLIRKWSLIFVPLWLFVLWVLKAVGGDLPGVILIWFGAEMINALVGWLRQGWEKCP